MLDETSTWNKACHVHNLCRTGDFHRFLSYAFVSQDTRTRSKTFDFILQKVIYYAQYQEMYCSDDQQEKSELGKLKKMLYIQGNSTVRKSDLSLG